MRLHLHERKCNSTFFSAYIAMILFFLTIGSPYGIIKLKYTFKETFMKTTVLKVTWLVLLCLCGLCVLSLILSAGAAAVGGGTAEDPYVVGDYDAFVDLFAIKSDETVYVVFGDDIIIDNNKQFKPLSNLVIDLCGHTVSASASSNINGNGHKITFKNGNVNSSIAFFNSSGSAEEYYALENLSVTTTGAYESCIWIKRGTVKASSCKFTTLGKGSSPISVGYSTVTYELTDCTMLAPEAHSAYTYAAGALTIDGKTVLESCSENEYSASRFEDINISLGEDIKVNYYVATEALEAPKMKFTVDGRTETVAGVTDGEQYRFTFAGVAPDMLGELITAELIVGDVAVEVKEYSVLEYLTELMAKSSAELGMSDERYDAMRRLINALLAYGGAAQRYTGHGADAPVDAGLAETETVLPTSTDKRVSNTENVTFTAATVCFDSVNKLRFKFNAADTSELSFKVKINNGEEADIAYFVDGDGYYIDTGAILAIGFDDVYTVTAYKSGVPDASATYSVKSYVHSKQGSAEKLAELVKATYSYGLAAKAYIGMRS